MPWELLTGGKSQPRVWYSIHTETASIAALLTEHCKRVVVSVTPMSKKGNCWDNAPKESFFGRLNMKTLHPYKLHPWRCRTRILWVHWAVLQHIRGDIGKSTILHLRLTRRSSIQHRSKWLHNWNTCPYSKTGISLFNFQVKSAIALASIMRSPKRNSCHTPNGHAMIQGSPVTTQTSSQTSSQNKNAHMKWAFTYSEEHCFIGCASRIWTCDLWVMSPTSYQAAPSRVKNSIITYLSNSAS
jgi:hypothetical protein